jgi:iron complex transport system ATP-binding protein
VVGPNGAGKSTLLRVLSGDLRAYDGTVALLGRPLRAWAPDALARARAVLPQESTLTFPFSALEVVMLGRTPHGGSVGAHARAICLEALAAVAMDAMAERLYPTLSGGERQRVQLARVLAQIWRAADAPGGRVLFLDEPIASLDLAQQHRALAVARRFAADGVAVLVVLHDLNLAAQHADRVAVLRDGALAAVGAPEAVLTPALVERVFGIPVAVVPHPAGGRPVLVPIAGAP